MEMTVSAQVISAELSLLKRPKVWNISNSWAPGAMKTEIGGHRWVEHNIDGTVSVAVRTVNRVSRALTEEPVIVRATGTLDLLDTVRDKAHRIWWIAQHHERAEVQACREPHCELCPARIDWVMPVTDAPGHWRQRPKAAVPIGSRVSESVEMHL